MPRVAIIGGGWAGLAAAVQAATEPHAVTLFEAQPLLGGRANSHWQLDPQAAVALQDPGQVLLSGTDQCLAGLLRQIGQDPQALVPGWPMAISTPQQHWPWPVASGALAQAWGLLCARGWRTRERWALWWRLRQWQRLSFDCSPSMSVLALVPDWPERLVLNWLRPLCWLMLGTAPERASAQAFLHRLREWLDGPPRHRQWQAPGVALRQLLPMPAQHWLNQHGVQVRCGQAVQSLRRGLTEWWVDEQVFDHVILACPPREAVRLLREAQNGVGPNLRQRLQHWMGQAERLEPVSSTTLYLRTPDRLPHPLMLLPEGQGPAHWALDHGQLPQPPLGDAQLVALVAHHSGLDSDRLQTQMLAQARQQLGLHSAQVVHTAVVAEASYAWVAGQSRPQPHIAQGLTAAGAWVHSPGGSALEAAVRSGLMAALGAEGISPPKPVPGPAPGAPDTPAATPASGETAPADPPPGAPN